VYAVQALSDSNRNKQDVVVLVYIVNEATLDVSDGEDILRKGYVASQVVDSADDRVPICFCLMEDHRRHLLKDEYDKCYVYDVLIGWKNGEPSSMEAPSSVAQDDPVTRALIVQDEKNRSTQRLMMCDRTTESRDVRLSMTSSCITHDGCLLSQQSRDTVPRWKWVTKMELFHLPYHISSWCSSLCSTSWQHRLVGSDLFVDAGVMS
jgi:hypothetical protein